MTKILKTLILFFGLFVNNLYADILRPTTFDDRPNCEKSKGMWRDFGNSCVGKCESKMDKFAVCSYAITFGCDCGANRCYHQDKCILISEYIKIHEQKILEEQKISDDYKIKRQNAFKKFQNGYINKLAGIFGQDPNYIHNHPREPRPLAQNEFKNTNRLLIYNEIIKKKNERSVELQKKYDEELNKIKEDKEKSLAEKEEMIKKINEEKSKLKVIAELKEVAPKEEKTNKKSINNKIDQNNKKDEPSIFTNLTENNIENENSLENENEVNNLNELPSNQINKSEQKAVQRVDDSKKVPTTFDEYVRKINDVANNISQNNLNAQNIGDSEIPPLYIKEQKGDQDFSNNNQVPQFEN